MAEQQGHGNLLGGEGEAEARAEAFFHQAEHRQQASRDLPSPAEQEEEDAFVGNNKTSGITKKRLLLNSKS